MNNSPNIFIQVIIFEDIVYFTNYNKVVANITCLSKFDDANQCIFRLQIVCKFLVLRYILILIIQLPNIPSNEILSFKNSNSCGFVSMNLGLYELDFNFLNFHIIKVEIHISLIVDINYDLQ